MTYSGAGESVGVGAYQRRGHGPLPDVIQHSSRYRVIRNRSTTKHSSNNHSPTESIHNSLNSYRKLDINLHCLPSTNISNYTPHCTHGKTYTGSSIIIFLCGLSNNLRLQLRDSLIPHLWYHRRKSPHFNLYHGVVLQRRWRDPHVAFTNTRPPCRCNQRRAILEALPLKITIKISSSYKVAEFITKIPIVTLAIIPAKTNNLSL